VIDAWRTAELRFDLGLTLLEQAWLLGEFAGEASAGEKEAESVFAQMGADGLIERLRAGAGRQEALRRSGSQPMGAKAADSVVAGGDRLGR
jgi:hypothetical protein